MRKRNKLHTGYINMQNTPCNNVETNDWFRFDVRVNILIGELIKPYFVSTDMKIDEGRNV